MSELNDFFKLMAEGKKTDPKAIQAKEIKENIKTDLGGLFSQMAEMKKQDPLYQRNKKLEEQIHEGIKNDLGSLFAELASLKSKKEELIAENPELVDKPIEESLDQLAEEILIEVAPLNTPIGNIPVDQQLEPEKNPVVDMDSITKYLGSSETTKEEPKSTNTSQYDIDLINKKIKFIEQWVSKIQNAGPGSGEVNLRYLDDVDRSTIVDGWFLKYNDSTKKFDFASPTATSFNPTDIRAVYAEVKNADTVTIHKGDPVFLYRATGNRASVILAKNTSDAYSAKTLGLAYADFDPGQTGLIITKGTLTGIDTSMYAEGDTVYLGATSGTLTNVKPHSPNHLVYIGVVERANQGQGQIYVSPQNGYELEELHNVNIGYITALADGHYLKWSAADNQWVNTPFPAQFSGSYTDLTNKPTIPTVPTTVSSFTNDANYVTSSSLNTTLGSFVNNASLNTILGDYASKSYVTTAISDVIGAAPDALNTLKEIADQLAADESAVSSLTTTVAGKVSLTGSYANPTWITSLAYGKLTGAPTNVSTFTNDSGYLSSVSWSQVTGKPDAILTLNDTNVVSNAMLVNKSITIGSTAVDLGASITTLTGLTGVTSNSTTAFIAGAAAESNVALQMPRESALRNLTNGFNNMYFDVSNGGSAHGAFQFRSSNGYTNVLTMSPTSVSFNTGATVTARTASVARTSFNAAIDTEIIVDEMRFRISNQGGIFPQVIGHGSSRNLAWTGVGAISGSAVTQVGSTGTIVASNAWTTLYNAHGMDSPGDTITVTLQDKAGGRIYRVTFMRSDNGTTTGYNIIAERIL